MGGITGKGGDNSAEDSQIALEKQEYADEKQEEQEQVDRLDKEEIGFLHNMGGMSYVPSNTPPVNSSSIANVNVGI